jgi:hypothetical protein
VQQFLSREASPKKQCRQQKGDEQKGDEEKHIIYRKRIKRVYDLLWIDLIIHMTDFVA